MLWISEHEHHSFSIVRWLCFVWSEASALLSFDVTDFLQRHVSTTVIQMKCIQDPHEISIPRQVKHVVRSALPPDEKGEHTHVQDDGEAWWSYLTQNMCVLTYTPPIFYTLLQIIEKRIIKKASSSSWSAGTMVPKMVEEEYEFQVRLRARAHTHTHTRSRWIKERICEARRWLGGMGWEQKDESEYQSDALCIWSCIYPVKIATFMIENWTAIDS